MVERYQVIQTMLDLFADARYLEIGVDSGETFHKLVAGRKVAVDPAFKFPRPLNNPLDTVAYHQVTSDEYFSAADWRKAKFDVIYIDGLHTFEQVLRDLLNSVEFLSPDGVIIVDDILPNAYESSLKNLNDMMLVRQAQRVSDAPIDMTWMGDVYRLAFFIRSFMQQFCFATVLENHGQLVLWRQPRETDDISADTVADVAAVEFSQTLLRRDEFNVQPLATILGAIVARHGSDNATLGVSAVT